MVQNKPTPGRQAAIWQTPAVEDQLGPAATNSVQGETLNARSVSSSAPDASFVWSLAPDAPTVQSDNLNAPIVSIFAQTAPAQSFGQATPAMRIAHNGSSAPESSQELDEARAFLVQESQAPNAFASLDVGDASDFAQQIVADGQPSGTTETESIVSDSALNSFQNAPLLRRTRDIEEEGGRAPPTKKRKRANRHCQLCGNFHGHECRRPLCSICNTRHAPRYRCPPPAPGTIPPFVHPSVAPIRVATAPTTAFAAGPAMAPTDAPSFMALPSIPGSVETWYATLAEALSRSNNAQSLANINRLMLAGVPTSFEDEGIHTATTPTAAPHFAAQPAPHFAAQPAPHFVAQPAPHFAAPPATPTYADTVRGGRGGNYHETCHAHRSSRARGGLARRGANHGVTRGASTLAASTRGGHNARANPRGGPGRSYRGGPPTPSPGGPS